MFRATTVTLALTGVVMLGLTACGGESDSDTGSDTGTDQPGDTATEQAADTTTGVREDHRL